VLRSGLALAGANSLTTRIGFLCAKRFQVLASLLSCPVGTRPTRYSVVEMRVSRKTCRVS
jgi:hypothetical protein